MHHSGVRRDVRLDNTNCQVGPGDTAPQPDPSVPSCPTRPGPTAPFRPVSSCPVSSCPSRLVLFRRGSTDRGAGGREPSRPDLGPPPDPSAGHPSSAGASCRAHTDSSAGRTAVHSRTQHSKHTTQHTQYTADTVHSTHSTQQTQYTAHTVHTVHTTVHHTAHNTHSAQHPQYTGHTAHTVHNTHSTTNTVYSITEHSIHRTQYTQHIKHSIRHNLPALEVRTHPAQHKLPNWNTIRHRCIAHS